MASDHAVQGRREAIVRACRQLATDGLVIGTAGNVSERVGDLVLVTATGADFATIEAEHVTLVDLAGEVIGDGLAPTSEVDLHLGVYARTAARAVVHTHAPMATAVGCVVDELPVVHYQMLSLGGAVRVAPYATFGSPDLADAVLAALDGRTAALMSNHGALTHGAGLDEALAAARLLEWACTVFWRAAAIGTPRTLDAAAQADVVQAYLARSYGTPRPATESRPS